jgi:hypothetical protein
LLAFQNWTTLMICFVNMMGKQRTAVMRGTERLATKPSTAASSLGWLRRTPGGKREETACAGRPSGVE